MAWTEPKYSRSQVDKAGQLLAEDADKSDAVSPEEWDQALAIINNWRSSHGYPLYMIGKTLLRRARKVDEKALVAQRLKRLDSISLKLRRFEKMQLSRMQDIGGCRAILGNAEQVTELAEIYMSGIRKNPRNRMELTKYHDYINKPKSDGYRSYHLIFKYRSASEQSKKYNGLRIEIQLRSRMQHAWATAVETVSTFTGQALKSDIGEDSWKRFFTLMGTAIARQERPYFVDDMPLTEVELREELVSLCKSLQVEDVLMGYRAALQVSRFNEFEKPYQKGQSLLVLNTDERRIEVRTFAHDNAEGASKTYLHFEKKARSNPSLQVVLVSVDSLSKLRSAYPNYYLDTTAFLRAVKKATQ